MRRQRELSRSRRDSSQLMGKYQECDDNYPDGYFWKTVLVHFLISRKVWAHCTFCIYVRISIIGENYHIFLR